MAKKAIALLFGMCCLAVTAFSQTAEKPKSLPAPKPENFSAVASLPRARTVTAWVDVPGFAVLEQCEDSANSRRVG